MLVIGSANSSNSHRLREVAEQCGVRAHLIDNAAGIDRRWLTGVRRVGVTAGASAPESPTRPPPSPESPCKPMPWPRTIHKQPRPHQQPSTCCNEHSYPLPPVNQNRRTADTPPSQKSVRQRSPPAARIFPANYGAHRTASAARPTNQLGDRHYSDRQASDPFDARRRAEPL